jgi:hypothetical protein
MHETALGGRQWFRLYADKTGAFPKRLSDVGKETTEQSRRPVGSPIERHPTRRTRPVIPLHRPELPAGASIDAALCPSMRSGRYASGTSTGTR